MQSFGNSECRLRKALLKRRPLLISALPRRAGARLFTYRDVGPRQWGKCRPDRLKDVNITCVFRRPESFRATVPFASQTGRDVVGYLYSCNFGIIFWGAI